MMFPTSVPAISMKGKLMLLMMTGWWCQWFAHHQLPFADGACVVHSHDVADFVPLGCNEALERTMDLKLCTSWSHYFSAATSNTTFTSRVVIPCGICLVIDHHHEDSVISNVTLNFEDGLDIQGKLVILADDDFFVTIHSTLIVVQGELVVDSANQTVDGNPRVRFVLTGNQEQSFEPVGENALVCDHGNQPCQVGKKAFVVAGGSVRFHGMPSSYKIRTWVPLQRATSLESEDSPTPNLLVVENSVPWAVGAELLITSHTHDWDGDQVRRIRRITPLPYINDWVQLELDAPLPYRPTTRQDDGDMAVEVALLSRSILLESDPEDGGQDEQEQGGHFMIMNTPHVVQKVIGVEFRNLGQQGCLGRYSIHFHFLQNSTGSVIEKNSIVGSHQRCVVVHGTDNLVVADNVAYNTKGHCFMLEDGIETGNLFLRNLGARTGRPNTLIPNLGSNGYETDQFIPSTFWITNPLNVFVGNVAAGSEGSGYWFELKKRGIRAHLFDLDPKSADLIRFKYNVAHSNTARGFRTYPSGYLPDSLQQIENLKAYRNLGSGIFLHITRNVQIVGLFAADNRNIGVDIDRADAIIVSNSTIVGASDHYVELMGTQGIGDVCREEGLYGIELHTWKHDPDQTNATIIENVVFQGFEHSPACPYASFPFHLDDNTRTTQFDAYTSIAGISVQDFSDPIDFCDASNATVVDAYITDLDGSLCASCTSGPSTLLGLHSVMQAFVDPAKCTDNESRCYSYCKKTCFRSVRFGTDPFDTENLKLKVCKRGSGQQDSPNCIEIRGYLQTDRSFAQRAFIAHLPSGIYDAVFLDLFGSETWPVVVNIRWETALCPTSLSDDDIHLIVPEPTSDECGQLVKNGRMEESDNEPKHWMSRFGSLKVSVGSGMKGSNALVGVEEDAATNFLQYVDTRCLPRARGQFYKLSADVKLTFANGIPWICNSSLLRCPEIGVYTNEQGYMAVASVEAEVGEDGFQRVTGFFQVQEDMVAATDIMLFIRSNVNDRIMYVDNVSMTLIPNANGFCKNVILHSDMENVDDWLKVWEIEGSGLLQGVYGPLSADISKPTDGSLRFGDRRDFSDGVTYTGWRDVEIACFKPGSSWKVVGQFELYDKRTGLPAECDLETTCPAIRLIVWGTSREIVFIEKVRSYTPMAWTTNSFNIFEADFTMPSAEQWDGGIYKIDLAIRDFPIELDLIVGSLVMILNP